MQTSTLAKRLAVPSVRRRPWARRLAVILSGLLLLIVAALVWLPEIVERNMNGIAATTRKTPSPRSQMLHDQLFIADLHANTLLWNRDLLQRGTRGHVDLPRLQEGNVGLQMFTIVTKAPRGMNVA